jgi:hypothetical protein
MNVEPNQFPDVGGPLSFLLYVSHVSIHADHFVDEVTDILTVSMARNTSFNITGMLIVTPRYFTQLMEGSLPAIESVMARIEADTRHTDIAMMLKGPLAKRIGGAWRLVRFEAGSFEERHVTPLLERCHADCNDENATALMALIRQLLKTPRDLPLEPHRKSDHSSLD